MFILTGINFCWELSLRKITRISNGLCQPLPFYVWLNPIFHTIIEIKIYKILVWNTSLFSELLKVVYISCLNRM